MGQPDLSMEQLIDFLKNVDPHLLAFHTNRPLFIGNTGHKEFSVFYAPVVEGIDMKLVCL